MMFIFDSSSLGITLLVLGLAFCLLAYFLVRLVPRLRLASRIRPKAAIAPDLPAHHEAVFVIQPGGRIVITVPHTNKALSPKHYQHFNKEKLTRLLSPYFEDLQFTFFDSRSPFLRILSLLIGGQGKYFVVTAPAINRWFFSVYRRRFLKLDEEKDCRRIACTGRIRAR